MSDCKVGTKIEYGKCEPNTCKQPVIERSNQTIDCKCVPKLKVLRYRTCSCGKLLLNQYIQQLLNN